MWLFGFETGRICFGFNHVKSKADSQKETLTYKLYLASYSPFSLSTTLMLLVMQPDTKVAALPQAVALVHLIKGDLAVILIKHVAM